MEKMASVTTETKIIAERIVLVCGGRNYKDSYTVFSILGKLHEEDPFTKVVQGEARGADKLGKMWARQNGITVKGYKADWDRYYKAAGPIRNSEMLEKEDIHLVVAFPGDTGTADMVKKAKAAGIEVIEVLEVE